MIEGVTDSMDEAGLGDVTEWVEGKLEAATAEAADISQVRAGWLHCPHSHSQ